MPNHKLSILVLLSSSVYANWQIISGADATYSTMSFNITPVNMPEVDNNGNTYYLNGSVGTTYPLMLIDDDSYSDRNIYSSNFNSNLSVGLKKPISLSWLFKIKGIYNNSSTNILNINTYIYTAQTSPAVPDNSFSCNGSACTLPSIMANSQETITVTQNPYTSILASFLYNFSDRFSLGPAFVANMNSYTLSLNNNSQTSNFKPQTNSLGLEGSFKINKYVSIATSLQFSQKNSFIKRLLNFEVTANGDSYSISYIPVNQEDGNNPWQACNGYLIANSTCDTYVSNQTVTNYYYNINTPSNYGTTVNVNTIDSTIGPQQWFNNYSMKASIALEFAYDLEKITRKFKQ